MNRFLTTMALAASAAGAAPAQDLPARKPGLWQMKMTMAGQPMPMPPAQHCVDAQTDKLMSATGSGAAAGACSSQQARREGDTFVVDSVCKMGPATTRTRAVISGDFNSAYKVDVTSSSGGTGETRMTIEATWLGPCKAGQ